MRIQHNIMAMNAYRNYTNNTSALAKNLEKLSSGYRINRAGDDAAGLAISEKMRAQITALGTAQKNVKDGISLVKTAEGATQEVHDMLNRMVDLATQSANGTYQDDVDREAIQSEYEALKTEINRISKASNFNGIKLLDGSMNGVGEVQYSDATVTPVDDGLRGGAPAAAGEYTFDLKGLELTLSAAAGASIGANANAFTITIGTKTVATISFAAGLSKGETVAVTTGDITVKTDVTIGTLTFGIELNGTQITLKGTKAAPTTTEAEAFKTAGIAIGVEGATDVTNNNGWDQSVHTVEALSPAAANKLAHGSFDLSAAGLKDGSIIKIGDETYSFKIGKDGKGATADHQIDLSDVETGDANFLQKAVEALSKQDNKIFDISAPIKDGTIHLNEKKDALKDYSEWNLQGGTGTTDAPWTNVATGKKVVQFGTMGAATGKSLTLQIGEDSKEYNQLTLDIKAMDTKSLGLDAVNLNTQDNAQKAVDVIKDAINYVSTVRSGLGATQNRLEHTANNLSTMKENIQDAEATIRDTDIAEEMMAYTKNNILVQSAQAMLAQANQIPQGVLQLLG